MAKSKFYATLLILLSIVAAAVLHTPALTKPKTYDFFYHGVNADGSLSFEPLRPPIFGVEPVGDTDPIDGDDVLRCSMDPVTREVLLVDTSVLTTVTSMYFRCGQGWYRVKGVVFR